MDSTDTDHSAFVYAQGGAVTVLSPGGLQDGFQPLFSSDVFY